MDFVSTTKVVPPPADLCSHLAALHRSSLLPANREFRFLTHNYQAENLGFKQGYPLWATFFGNLLRLLRQSAEAEGISWLKSHQGLETLIETTVPQLLEPLQSSERPIQPCLVHGSLSASNISINATTGKPLVFNPVALYAHNEYDVGIWRLPIDGLVEEYVNEYRRHFEPAEPVSQWEDRIRLYSIKFGLAYLLENPSALSVQKQVLCNIEILNQKYSV